MQWVAAGSIIAGMANAYTLWDRAFPQVISEPVCWPDLPSIVKLSVSFLGIPEPGEFPTSHLSHQKLSFQGSAIVVIVFMPMEPSIDSAKALAARFQFSSGKLWGFSHGAHDPPFSGYLR